MIHAIIFDYYGVIRPDIFIATYSHFGGDPVADAQFIADTIYASNSGHIPSSVPVIAKRLDISPHEWTTKISAPQKHDQQLINYIKQLKKDYKIALLSNVSRGRLKDILASGDLQNCFDVTIGSGETGYAKPDAEIFQLAAEKLGVELSECVMIDDRADYCQGAQKVGMRAIVYKTFPQFKRDLQKLLSQS
jgi:HAD superfamily hydrolase (TIGR01509 family)